jgi:hypothetical protein
VTLAPPSRRPVHAMEPVIGDGTTIGTRTRTRWQRVRWPLAVVATFVVVVWLSSLLTARTSTTPLAPDNPNPGGARALAEILRGQGVDIEYVRTLAGAASKAQEGTTLLITATRPISYDRLDELAAVDADIVLVAPEDAGLAAFTEDAVHTSLQTTSGSTQPGCDDPDAQAAEEIAPNAHVLVTDDPDVQMCFTTPGAGEEGMRTGTYAVLDEGKRRVTVIADDSLMTNQELDHLGNAALMLRALGRDETLVWYVPSASDASSGTETGVGLGDVLPPWAGVLVLQLLVLTGALALWRGRNLGPVVTEPLPVTVRAAEATIGRGRLYRKARSRGHAAAALRAGAATRTATRLGLPRSAGATDVIDAVARATGRTIEQVAGLLYGPPPTDDTGLLRLARQLDELESEVHRT